MSTLHNLTLRTATAVGRLADLQRRVERPSNGSVSAIAKAALKELSSALEDLQVANEALQTQLDELNAVHTKIANVQQMNEEFAQALPIAVLWTDREGVIEKGNDAASQLLNIGRHHLVSKPLMFFITDRGPLFAALKSLCDAEGPGRGRRCDRSAARAASAQNETVRTATSTRRAVCMVLTRRAERTRPQRVDRAEGVARTPQC